MSPASRCDERRRLDERQGDVQRGADRATVNANTVLLRDPAGATVPASVTYDAASQTATLDPTAPSATSTAYTATVKGGPPASRTRRQRAGRATTAGRFTTRARSQSAARAASGRAPRRLPAHRLATPARWRSGVRFRAEVDGLITGVRFYKSTTNTGTHVGHLWTRTGQLLATATFTNETASGWQQVSFATPVAVTAEHDLCRLATTPERPVLGEQQPVRRRRRGQPAAARAPRRGGRRQRRLRLRAERDVPDRHVPVGGLLGRRGVRDRQPAPTPRRRRSPAACRPRTPTACLPRPTSTRELQRIDEPGDHRPEHVPAARPGRRARPGRGVATTASPARRRSTR